jgi:site-specific DNA-cytosine methylase
MQIKYANIIPLIGGMTIGNREAVGHNPEFIVSWSAFGKNDSHIVNYLNDVPYHVLPDDGEDTITPNIRNQYFEKIDFVSTVCPCAGLSMLNNASGSASARGSDASQNDWMYKSANWVLENIRPKVFWGENAPGLYTSVGNGVRTKLKEIAETYGYSFSIVKTDTYLHGIPQHRKRTFYFFWKGTNAPLLEWYERNSEHKDLIEYLLEIPNDSLYQDEFFTRSHPVTEWKLYEYVLEKTGLSDKEFRKSYLGALYHYISDMGWIDDAIKWMDEKYPNYNGEERTKLDHIKRKLADGKGYWDSSPFFVSTHVNAIIGKNMHVLVHPTEDRFLNIRECMWLMGLPHNFSLTKENQVWNHIAQNVPVKTAKSYTEQVIKYINGELRDSGNQFIMQDNNTKQVTDSEKLVSFNKKSFKVTATF